MDADTPERDAFAGQDGRLSPYPPLNTLKPLADGLWIIDGPVVGMRYGVGTLPFSTRTTVIRLSDGRLWIHSPGALPPALREEIGTLGPVAWLVAPNRLHWLGLAAWQRAFPGAATLVAPGVEQKAAEGGFTVSGSLAGALPPDWEDHIACVPVPGAFMTEAVFFHHSSATVIVTDLIENFDPGKVNSRWLRALMSLGGVLHPHGGTPRDLRLTFLPRRAEARAAARRILSWRPERLILSHGRCIEDNASARLREALSWTGVR